MSGGTESAAEGAVISLPKGGGAVSGVGEKFAADLFTGTGNFTVPIAVPAGRSGLAPQLALGYSTGNGNGPFGLGWQLSLPGVSRRTSRGIPRYADAVGPGADRADVFVLSGAEDLVPVQGGYPGRVRYRPRTEGLFARIEHVKDGSGNYWEVRGKDGLLTRYGTPRPAGADAGWRDPAVTADPADPGRVFGWRVTLTQDALGNLIRYEYLPDRGQELGHRWDHPLIARISYGDYGDRADPSFLIEVDFGYEPRPDPFSDHRAGFELRTSLRCRTVRVTTHAADGIARVAREQQFTYRQAEFNGVSLLTQVDVTGVDDQDPASGQAPATEALPPLTFGYSGFDPAGRRFREVTGPGLPAVALSDPTLALVDLHGTGLPDVVELGTARRVWRNMGEGRFELPRRMTEAPPLSLADPGVRFMDADGDGRPDLVVSATVPGSKASGAVTGYYPMTFASGWSHRSFQAYRQSPAVALADPSVKLVDLDGDGLTDVLRSGTRLECWFNDPDPRKAWQRTAVVDGTGPQVDLADPRVRLADMTGDGLQDIVLLRNGNIAYWPNLGHGRWGARVTMSHAPRLPDGYDPRRVLLGDVDGDGAADLLYVDRGRVQLWGNRSGNAWTEQPVTITGTPAVTDRDSVQLSDLYGTGMAGLLFSRAADASGRPRLRFLDLTGGVKPHLLHEMDNHLGAVTRVTYTTSTQEYLRDQRDPATRWRTTLPFPVQVVSHVEVTDAISGGRLSTGHRYHHGYWDGVEREFRGFAMVETLDTETFQATPTTGPGAVPDGHYSPPTLTKSWFHPGPVAADEPGDWTELDLRHEYSPADTPMLPRPPAQNIFLAALPAGARRAALRTLRGQLLRTELYALDGAAREYLPYTVTESVSGVREESPPATDRPVDTRERIFFPFSLGSRTTQYERGNQPMTQFAFPAGYDAYGLPTGHLAVAVPRGRDPMTTTATAPPQPYLATYATTEYAVRDDLDRYLAGRVVRATSYEVVNDGRPSVADLCDGLLAGLPAAGVSLRVIGHVRTHYDGDAFAGLPLGTLGDHGLPVRTESLAFTDGFLDELHPAGDPLAVGPRPVYLAPGGVTAWPAEYPPEFRAALPALGGYLHYTDTDVPGSPGGYYVATARRRYDVHDPARVGRGLQIASLDPLGAESRIDYDRHDLLPVLSVDPAGLETAAVHDYRVLQPRETTDANGNTNRVTFSPTGLVTAHYVSGKNGEGDHDAPSTRLTYDLLAFAERGRPASVRTVRRKHHDTDTDVPAAQRDDVIVSVQYSDGFGRLLQTRSQAEDTLFGDPTFGGGVIPAEDLAPVGDTTGRTRAPSDPDNVIVSGWQIYDNKGRVVEKYEPFFSTGFDYAQPLDAQSGQRTTMFYDPRGQTVRTLNADGGEHRVVFGIPADLSVPEVFTPTPWESYAYDSNDNAGRTHGDAAARYRSHWNTPASVEIDALGRTVRAVARNGATSADWFTTRSVYDIQGNLVSITDPLARVAFTHRYDLGKRRWRLDSIDAGRHDMVPDALGNPIESRDSKGALRLGAFDVLHRPMKVWARDDVSGTVTLHQVDEYGDGGTAGQPAADRAAARALNLLGMPVRRRDEAGLVTVAAVDFKGGVLESTRRVIADAPVLATYAAARAKGWQVVPFQVEWTPGAGQTQAARDATLLEPAGYVTTTSYDALNRIVRHLLPTDVTGHRGELRPVYNRAGALEAVALDGTVHVRRIAYDAKGQRVLIAYGNGVMTRYAYDVHTFRLARLRTEHYTSADGPAYRPTGGAPVQDLGYDYDLVGNVLAIRDRTPGSGILNNPDALAATDPLLRKLLGSGDALDRRFVHDPSYRLLSATGREYQSPPIGDPWIDLPRGTDATKAQPYAESYAYDAVGNMLGLLHRGTGGFTRAFTVTAGSNRPQRMDIGKTPYSYAFDPNGNLVSETTSRHYSWNHADRLKAFATQVTGAEPSVHAQYLYDAAGRRVKKLVRRQGGAVEVTHYLDEIFEHHRWAAAATTEGSAAAAVPATENNHIHVMDDRRRVALVRSGPAHPEDRGPAVAFPLTDHLGSSTAVLDGAGTLTNSEEYTPYGETSFGSYTRKRYRFTGKERDEESGLTYHVARYCCPWLARWISCDPLGSEAGLNLYQYVRSSPLGAVDPSGEQPQQPSNPDNLGNIAPYDKQPKAGRDASGARTTESEHVVHRAGSKAVTHDANTGTSDYTDSHYRKDTTVRIGRDTALDKTHASRGGANADNARAAGLKAKIQAGQPINYREDVFLPSVDNAHRAAAATNSPVPAHKINEAALAQDGNLFAIHTAEQAGRTVASRGYGIADHPDTLEFDLNSGPSTPARPTAVPPAGPELTAFRKFVSPESLAKGLEIGGYAAFSYELATAKTPTQVMKATTNFMGATVGGSVGAGVAGGVGLALCGPCEPVFQAGGAAVGTYVGGHATEIADEIDWKETAFVGLMVLACFL
ncbi:FG-GAP-like repeat-containing protein [Streptomyces sp. NBC_00988]|uniref:SpvB/TcaC N-terminal domain-containing protein n=1 Tax=Streptomyces sp. NBC_00988 TaxID=2903704 RepID=UPI0038633FBF|nr:FG-GAP-like repeat-containing protein [Streptomyces sp. NBC_00988]